MENIDYLLLLRYALYLLTGFWIARKLRSPLRDFVLRCMPIRYRMSESSFNIQTRISAIVGIILVLLVAWGMNWGVNEISQLFYKTTPDTTPRPIPTIPKVEESQDQEAIPLSMAPTISVPPTVVDIPPSYDEVKPAPGKPASPISTTLYFLQVEAFEQETRAWRKKAKLERLVPEKIWIGNGIVADRAPFKVLIGPFDSHAATMAYQRATRLNGFPQAAHRIRLLPD